MTRPLALAQVLALALALMPAGSGRAADSAERSGDHRDRTGGIGFSAILTSEVTDKLRLDLTYCGTITVVYSFECYRYALRLAGDALDGNTAYRAAETALTEADRQIRDAVKTNIDRTRLPRLNGFQYYRPVLPAQEAELRAATAVALGQARDRILATPDSEAGAYLAPIAGALNAGVDAVGSDRS